MDAARFPLTPTQRRTFDRIVRRVAELRAALEAEERLLQVFGDLVLDFNGFDPATTTGQISPEGELVVQPPSAE